jgi:bla regulator protein blaR1
MQNIETITHGLSWALLHSLWQGALIGFVLFLGLRVLSPSQAIWRYRLAIMALALVLLTALGTFWRQLNTTMVNVSAPLTADADLQWTEQLIQFFNQQVSVLMACWLLGMAIFLLRLAWGLWAIGQLKKNASPLAASPWQLVFEEVTQRIGLGQALILAESNRISTPITLGWLKPMVLVPSGLLSGLSKEQVEAIFAHELAHVLRRDYLFNLLQTLVECIFYFNPGVWYISAVLRREREHCCDDWVLVTQNNPILYAKTLLYLQEWHKKAAPKLALGAIGNEKPLLRRIQRILQSPSNTSDMFRKLSLGGMLLLVLGALALQSMRAPKSLAQSAVFARDTVPVPSGDRNINLKNYKSKNVWLTLENNQVKNLQIDGKTIDPADYPKYQELIEDLKKITPPPPPPAPPAPDQWVEVPAPAAHPNPAPKGKPNGREIPPPPPLVNKLPTEAEWEQAKNQGPPPPPPPPPPVEAQKAKPKVKMVLPPPPPPPPPAPKKGKESPE